MRRYAAIGSSHLFGLIDEFVEPVATGRFSAIWTTGVPVPAELPFDIPGWTGTVVLYNTPDAGPPPFIKDNVLFMPDELLRMFSAVPRDVDVIFSFMRGHEFAIGSLVDDPSHGDFIGDDGGFESGRQWMSRMDANAWVRALARPILTTNLALKNHFPKARILHVAAPSPVESEEHISQNQEGFGELFAEHGIKPFSMRRRIYDLMYGLLARDLAAHGIGSLMPPGEALTPSRGLRSDYANGCLHGNTRYARALVKQFQQVLRDDTPV